MLLLRLSTQQNILMGQIIYKNKQYNQSVIYKCHPASYTKCRKIPSTEMTILVAKLGKHNVFERISIAKILNCLIFRGHYVNTPMDPR
jgi:hypothetical protein